MKRYNVIGLMSGTSLDGIDIAYCHFNHDGEKWMVQLDTAITICYDYNWKNKLSNAMNSDAISLVKLHKEYGRYLGKVVLDFIQKNKCDIDFVSSHGHT